MTLYTTDYICTDDSNESILEFFNDSDRLNRAAFLSNSRYHYYLHLLTFRRYRQLYQCLTNHFSCSYFSGVHGLIIMQSPEIVVHHIKQVINRTKTETMCSYNSLVNNESGYVIECKKCNKIHIGFGTTMLTYSMDGFAEFVTMLRKELKYGKTIGNKTSKEFKIPTDLRTIVLIYSYNELVELNELISSAEDKISLSILHSYCDN